MKGITLLCVITIALTTAEICPGDYSVVFKYSEPQLGQILWEPLLPEERNKNPDIKALYEENKNCVIELDCGERTNLTGIVLFENENPDNEAGTHGSGESGHCEASSDKDCNKGEGADDKLFMECDETYGNNISRRVQIEIVEKDKCNGYCFEIISNETNSFNNSKVAVVKASIEKLKTNQNINEKKEKDLTPLYVITGILGVIAASALLFFASKTVIAYFKSKSYNIGDAEANVNANRATMA